MSSPSVRGALGDGGASGVGWRARTASSLKRASKVRPVLVANAGERLPSGVTTRKDSVPRTTRSTRTSAPSRSEM